MLLKGVRMTALLNEVLTPSLRKKFLFRKQVVYFANPKFFRI